MHYRKEPTQFERRWLERIEQRSERRSEWKRLSLRFNQGSFGMSFMSIAKPPRL